MPIVYFIHCVSGLFAFGVDGWIVGWLFELASIKLNLSHSGRFIATLIGLVLFYFCYCLLGIGYCRLIGLFVRTREGDFRLENPRRSDLVQHLRITADTMVVGLCRPLLLIMPFLITLLGARTGSGFVLGGKVLNAELFEAGDDVLVGDGALVTGHVVQGGRSILQRVILEDRVTVGVRSIVLPGVRVGAGSLVAAGSVVPMGTVIPPGETWGGVPAKKI